MLTWSLIFYSVCAVAVLWLMLDYRYREEASDISWWFIILIAITWPFWLVWFMYDFLRR